MPDNVMERRNKCFGETVAANLRKNGFDSYYCNDRQKALKMALKLIPKNHVVSWGGSVTIQEIGLLKEVRNIYRVIDRDKAATMEEKSEMMRQALLCDTFLMSSNGISEDGQLVNIDGTGNRCAALIYGPRQVLVLAGINKITKTIEDALTRARNTAAPINVQRFPDLNVPCHKTGLCSNCQGEDSVCCQIVLTRRCRPAGRIKVILIGENLGY
ncbi:MAG: lactate utilization protein [Phascolarctobacterium sp.]|nr:lactate utilization protein [Phascolarctobacterium sp.]